MGNLLDTPVTEKEGEAFTSRTGLSIGVSSMQGWRSDMEDAHLVADLLVDSGHLIVGVFDGHAGEAAAQYAAASMVKILTESKKWQEYLAALPKKTCGPTTGDSDSDSMLLRLLGDALQAAFIKVDAMLRVHLTEINDHSGCTAIVALVTPDHVICANVGDSRCVIGTASTAKAMSDDHKPENLFERRRIESAGGTVSGKPGRIDHALAVSRGLGDFQFKDNKDLKITEQKVSCYPDIIVHERCAGDDFLLLACDGLWDVMSNLDAIMTVREMRSRGETDPKKLADAMVDLALDRGSKDNISIIVIKFPEKEREKGEEENVEAAEGNEAEAEGKTEGKGERLGQGERLGEGRGKGKGKGEAEGQEVAKAGKSDEPAGDSRPIEGSSANESATAQ